MTVFVAFQRHLRPWYPGLFSFVATAAVIAASPAGAQERDHVVLGAGAVLMPSYQGADSNRTLPMPAIDIKEGWFVANLRNGIGLAPINTKAVTIGASAVFLQGYRRVDVPTGIDRLTDGVGARLYATVRAAGFVTTLGAVKGVAGGTKGTIADASVSYTIPVSSKFSLTPSIGATWADARHNDGYFGVTRAESILSRRPRFVAGSGMKDASVALTAAYRLTPRITVTATGTYTTLLNAVKDSPQVERRNAPAGFLTASYRL